LNLGPFAGNPNSNRRWNACDYTPALGFTGRDSSSTPVADSRKADAAVLATVNIQIVGKSLQKPADLRTTSTTTARSPHWTPLFDHQINL